MFTITMVVGKQHHEKFAIEVGKHISRTYLADLQTQVRQPRLRIIK